MATNATAATRLGWVKALKSPASGWDFLWTEYLASRAETERHRRETVQPADARIAQKISRFPPFNLTKAAARAMDAERSRLLREAAADYGEIQRRHGALVEETCHLQEALIMTPAPDSSALLWKLEQLLGTAAVCREAREAVIGDARRLLGPAGAAPGA